MIFSFNFVFYGDMSVANVIQDPKPIVPLSDWKESTESEQTEKDETVCGICLSAFSNANLPYGHEIVNSMGVKYIGHLNHESCWVQWASTINSVNRVIDGTHFGIKCPLCEDSLSIEASADAVQKVQDIQRREARMELERKARLLRFVKVMKVSGTLIGAMFAGAGKLEAVAVLAGSIIGGAPDIITVLSVVELLGGSSVLTAAKISGGAVIGCVAGAAVAVGTIEVAYRVFWGRHFDFNWLRR